MYICGVAIVLLGVVHLTSLQTTTTAMKEITRTDFQLSDPPNIHFVLDQQHMRVHSSRLLSSMTYELLKDCVQKYRHLMKYVKMYYGTVNFEIGLYTIQKLLDQPRWTWSVHLDCSQRAVVGTARQLHTDTRRVIGLPVEIKLVFRNMVKLYRDYSNRSTLNVKNENTHMITSWIFSWYYNPNFTELIVTETMAAFLKMHGLYNQILFLRNKFYETIAYHEMKRRNASLHKTSTLTVPMINVGRRKGREVMTPFYDSSENSGEYELDYFGHRIFKSTKQRSYTTMMMRNRIDLDLTERPSRRNFDPKINVHNWFDSISQRENRYRQRIKRRLMNVGRMKKDTKRRH